MLCVSYVGQTLRLYWHKSSPPHVGAWTAKHLLWLSSVHGWKLEHFYKHGGYRVIVFIDNLYGCASNMARLQNTKLLCPRASSKIMATTTSIGAFTFQVTTH